MGEQKRNLASAEHQNILAEVVQKKMKHQELERPHWACVYNCSITQCRQFFILKWEYEAKIQEECIKLDKLREELTKLQKITGAALNTNLSLEDFEIANLD